MQRIPDVDEIILGDNLEALEQFADESFQLVYVDPPFNTGGASAASRWRRSPTRTAIAPASADAGTARRCSTRARTATSSTTTSRSSSRGSRGRVPPAEAERHALLPHRLPRGPLLQGPARRDLRPGVLPQRDHLGLRLRRAHEAALAGEARQHPRLREGSRARTSSTRRRSTAIPYMAPGLVGAGEGGARQAPDRHLVAHDRHARPARRRPATRPRSRSASCGASSQASSPPGDWCLDFFAGSGTPGAAAAELGRRFVLVDSNPEAWGVMQDRLGVLPQAASPAG